MGAGKNFLTRLFLGELFIWPAAPIIHGAYAGYALTKTYQEEQRKKKISEREAEAAKFEGYNWKQFFKEENMTEEDKRMLWYGFVPVKEKYRRYVFLREKVGFIPHVPKGVRPDPKAGGADWGWCYGYPKTEEKSIDQSSYGLFPEMKIIHDTFKEVNGHYMWETDEIIRLNTLSELSKVCGYSSEDTKFFNWLANGYIRISETDWGFVGYANVMKVLEAANGEDFLWQPNIIDLNKDSGLPWKIDERLYDTAWEDYNHKASELFEERDYKYTYNFIDFNISYISSIPFTKRHVDDLTKVFINGEPIVNPIIYGYVKLDKDKYLYTGLNISRQIYRKANNKSVFEHPFFSCKDHIVNENTIQNVYEKWIKQGKDPIFGEVQVVYGLRTPAVVIPWGKDGLKIMELTNTIYEEEIGQ